MPTDPYAPCPGGTGKKLKFCCSDLLGELEKIERMLEGEQRAACLEYIDGLQAKFPDRACLLSAKAMLETQLGYDDRAETTLATFRQKHPDNPVALAEESTVVAEKAGGAAAVARLQDALERCGHEIPAPVYEALGIVAQTLLAETELIAAQAHFVLQTAMGGGKDERPIEVLSRLNSLPSVPLFAKQDLPLVKAPDDALWKSSFTTAMEPTRRGAWRLAAAQLEQLAARVGDWPPIWHNIAVLRTWLADHPGAVAAWQKYASQQIPLDDAVEAEAMVQLLDNDSVDHTEMVVLTYAVQDAEALLARLTANPRTPQLAIDLARMAESGEPPPKGAYLVLDRPIPASGLDIQLADAPRVMGHAFMFGKQTDRPARLEVSAYRPELDEARSIIAEVCGDSLGAPGAEELEQQVPTIQHLMSWNWRLPEDTPPEHRLALMLQKRRQIMFERWPDLPQKIFGGKTAREAAADPALRNRVLAAILILELSTEQSTPELNLNELRTKLGLPTSGPLDPRQIQATELPLVRLTRVDEKQLSDQDLLELFRRADYYRHVAALGKLAHEVLARPSLAARVDRAQLYGLLAQIEPDTTQAIDYLNEARAAAMAAKGSTAPWDLAELAMRIARGDVPEAERLLQRIRTDHIREPGVAQALFQILSEAGIIGPDGKPTAAAGRGAPSIVVPQGGAAEPGKIWTPGGDEPAASGKKSALWTPGMD